MSFHEKDLGVIRSGLTMKRVGALISYIAYASTAIALIGLWLALELAGVTWRGSVALHTVAETVATVLAFVVGVAALVRLQGRPGNLLLFSVAGFVGTALLDGYNALVASAWTTRLGDIAGATLIPWAWSASRTFLATTLLLGWISARRDARLGGDGRIPEHTVLLVVGAICVLCCCVFFLLPLPSGYFPGIALGRPQELLPAGILAAAVMVAIRDRAWKRGVFEHWMVVSLIVGLLAQAPFMCRSTALFDHMFFAASGLRIASYGCVLIGLLASMQELFRVAERDQAASAQDLDNFAYAASHDLRAPLRAIDSLATWIAEDNGATLAQKSREHLDKMRQRVGRMERLLDDLLEYSRAGRMRGEVEEVDIAQLLEETVARLSPPNGFEVKITAEIESLRTNRSELAVVLGHLIENAIRHHDRTDGRVEVTVRDRGSYLEFSVSDDGPGIEPRFQSRVFAVFETLRPRDDVEGTGVGLSVVKKIVESRDGEISLESEGDRGTTFTFTWVKELRGELVHG